MEHDDLLRLLCKQTPSVRKSPFPELTRNCGDGEESTQQAALTVYIHGHAPDPLWQFHKAISSTNRSAHASE